MTLFRVVVNPTYADLQWFRFLVKKRPKSSPFYFSTPFKPSVYAVSGVWQSSCNRERYGWKDKNSKNQSKIIPLASKIRLPNPDFKPFFDNQLSGTIGRDD